MASATIYRHNTYPLGGKLYQCNTAKSNEQNKLGKHIRIWNCAWSYSSEWMTLLTALHEGANS